MVTLLIILLIWIIAGFIFIQQFAPTNRDLNRWETILTRPAVFIARLLGS